MSVEKVLVRRCIMAPIALLRPIATALGYDPATILLSINQYSAGASRPREPWYGITRLVGVSRHVRLADEIRGPRNVNRSRKNKKRKKRKPVSRQCGRFVSSRNGAQNAAIFGVVRSNAARLCVGRDNERSRVKALSSDMQIALDTRCVRWMVERRFATKHVSLSIEYYFFICLERSVKEKKKIPRLSM